MAIPLEGQCADTFEMPGCQLDRLMASEDRLDNVGCQEGELDTATYVARIDSLAARDLSDGLGFSSRQLIEPAMGSTKQGEEVVVRGRGDTPRCMDNQLRLDPATLQLGGDREIDQSIQMRCAVAIGPEDQAGEARSLELDIDRAGAKRDAVNEELQQLAAATGLFVIQVTCACRCLIQDGP